MKIGLAAYPFENNNLAFNVSQIEKAMRLAKEQSVDLLCFGESFLQGFDALSWNYEKDCHVAITQDSDIMHTLCDMTLYYGVCLLIGYMEKDADAIYSSCAVIAKGSILHNYRRISRGWKVPGADEHYREGCDTPGFTYKGHTFQIALCGDLWDYPERFRTEGTLLWPIYVNFSIDEWRRYEPEYAEQAGSVAPRALMVNSLSEDPKSHGGAFLFQGGKMIERLPYDTEGILVLEEG